MIFPRAINVLNFPDVNGKALCIMSSHRDPSIRKSGTANICIQNSDKSIDDKAVDDTFSSFGNILNCKILTDGRGQSKGYGFVQFESKDATQNAVDKLNGMLINDKQVYVGHLLREQESKEEREAGLQAYHSQIRRDAMQNSLMAPCMPMYPPGATRMGQQLCYGHASSAMIPSQGGFGYKLSRPGDTHVPHLGGYNLFSRTITMDSTFKKGFIDYTCADRILLVGDGDFSFGMCIAILIGDATNITVTSFDSYADLTKMYPMAQDNIDSLLALGGLVLHEVDATKMYEDPRFFLRKYDKIVYNMPHAGFLDGFGEHDEIMISRHRKLLTGYFKNASRMLNSNGEIHVRHHTEPPYDKWNIIELAKAEGLELLEETPFNPRDYPGYSNKRGAGDNADNSFRVGQCSTYKFVLAADCVSDKSLSIVFFMNSDL
ncbi:heavy metal-associated isoprenylated plant protein 41-like protein [Tanacetum coccineum]|uniref:Heavy metal-associated isoprenylated plant protein 41-like protein n=1 Tax=Tanacetum coccineum TaxID=301880 RepID=A0ABQ5H7E5_9ASTR